MGNDPVSAGKFKTYGTALGLPTMAFLIQPETYPLWAQIYASSDEAIFFGTRIPSMLLGDTASLRNPHFHCLSGLDTEADLDFDFAVRIAKATVAVAAETLGYTAGSP